jgi:hypothetical protein
VVATHDATYATAGEFVAAYDSQMPTAARPSPDSTTALRQLFSDLLDHLVAAQFEHPRLGRRRCLAHTTRRDDAAGHGRTGGIES